MHVFAADKQVYNRNSQHDREEDYRRRRSVGRISARISVEHIVDITDDRVHTGDVEVGSEERNGVAVSLERADEAGYHEVKDHRRDHRQGDLRKNSEF